MKNSIFILILLISIAACKKEQQEPIPSTTTATSEVYYGTTRFYSYRYYNKDSSKTYNDSVYAAADSIIVTRTPDSIYFRYSSPIKDDFYFYGDTSTVGFQLKDTTVYRYQYRVTYSFRFSGDSIYAFKAANDLAMGASITHNYTFSGKKKN